MADQHKPAEEPLVPDQISSDTDSDADRTRDAASQESIPDAEVVEDRAAAPEPAPRAAVHEQPAPVRPEPRRSGAFVGFLAGGVIAAAGGFALARYVPDGWPIGDTKALTAQIEQQAATMADLKAQIEALAARETPDVGAELTALRSEVESKLAALPAAPDAAALATEARAAAETALAGLETRLAALESRPAGTTTTAAGSGTGVPADTLAAFDQELQALKAAVASQSAAGTGASEELKALAASTESQLAAAAAEAEKLRAEAEAAGQAAMARAAAGRILAALDAGGPFSSAVSDLTETGHEVPAVLADAAATGVPTLPDLQRTFPDAARAALDAALKANMGESWTERVATYLRTQTGARSLAPLEGNDPDAVLSRAEAALDAGQVGTALTELAAMPEAAQPALADWTAAAAQREAATAAVAALSTALDAK